MGVLIVDDEAELADAIATYLQAFGFEAEYVVDGASALAAFDARPPKLVVLDVNLPDVNGFEVCRAMRAKSDVLILFLSARGSDDDQILALGFGGDDSVRKPGGEALPRLQRGRHPGLGPWVVHLGLAG